MAAGFKVILFSLLILIPLAALFVYLILLVVRALRKYIKGSPARAEAKEVRGTLGERLQENRVRGTLGERLQENRARCRMSQEFVAEAVGVSRQAVSKWENGTSDPSTANLIALAKLYGVSAEELLKEL